MSMTPDRFADMLHTGGKIEGLFISAGKQIAKRHDYYARHRKDIILSSPIDRSAEMRYRPDLVLWKTDSSPNQIIIEFEMHETMRKEITAEIVLAGLMGAECFVFVSNDEKSVACAERYGKVLRSRIRRIAKMEVQAILSHTPDDFQEELDKLLAFMSQ